MKIGLVLEYSGRRAQVPLEMVLQAEAIGFDSVWTSEVWGADAVSISGWILASTSRIRVGTAILQMSARTPANTAMTAMTLSQLSGNRFLLGLGASGPQVVEGWHGMPFAKPVTRMREYIQIMRLIMERREPVTFNGEIYQLPYQGPGATGLGKPLKSILAATPDIPIYCASFTPAGLRTAAELADGVLPVWLSPGKIELLEGHIEEGFSQRRDGKQRADFDVAPFVKVVVGDDLDACRRPVKEFLALYIGGMGAREKNFYNDYAGTLGYEAEAKLIQDLFLSGRKEEAARAVPDRLVDEIALVGPVARIRERAAAWRALGSRGQLGTLLLSIRQPDYLEVMADILLG